MTSNAEAAKVVETGNGETSIFGQEDMQQWILYVDGVSNENGFGIGMILISLEGHKIYCALGFGFLVSNNKAKYEALIAGLRLVKKLTTHNVKIYSDSQLVVNQVNDIYLARGKKIITYLEKAKG